MLTIISKLRLLWRCLFDWRPVKYANQNKLRLADVIFCPSFVASVSGPGSANVFLAKCLLEIYVDSHRPLVLQKDCADALIDTKISLVISQHAEGKYLDTFEVTRQAVQFFKEKGFKTVLVCAHPDHLWRAIKTLQKFNFRVLALDTSGTPYDRSADRWWAKRRLTFLIREFFARLYYYFNGHI